MQAVNLSEIAAHILAVLQDHVGKDRAIKRAVLLAEKMNGKKP